MQAPYLSFFSTLSHPHLLPLASSLLPTSPDFPLFPESLAVPSVCLAVSAWATPFTQHSVDQAHTCVNEPKNAMLLNPVMRGDLLGCPGSSCRWGDLHYQGSYLPAPVFSFLWSGFPQPGRLNHSVATSFASSAFACLCFHTQQSLLNLWKAPLSAFHPHIISHKAR